MGIYIYMGISQNEVPVFALRVNKFNQKSAPHF